MSRAAYTALAARGWAPWPGGACPLPPGAFAFILQSDGRAVFVQADACSWRRDVSPDGFVEPDEIVGWRLQ